MSRCRSVGCSIVPSETPVGPANEAVGASPVGHRTVFDLLVVLRLETPKSFSLMSKMASPACHFGMIAKDHHP